MRYLTSHLTIEYSILFHFSLLFDLVCSSTIFALGQPLICTVPSPSSLYELFCCVMTSHQSLLTSLFSQWSIQFPKDAEAWTFSLDPESVDHKIVIIFSKPSKTQPVGRCVVRADSVYTKVNKQTGLYICTARALYHTGWK